MPAGKPIHEALIVDLPDQSLRLAHALFIGAVWANTLRCSRALSNER